MTLTRPARVKPPAGDSLEEARVLHGYCNPPEVIAQSGTTPFAFRFTGQGAGANARLRHKNQGESHGRS